MNPYVFVFGCPRSGTTVVQRILDANPSLCMFPSEQKWIVRYMEQIPEEKLDEEMSLNLLSKLLEEDHPVWMKRCAPQIDAILAERVSFREFIVRAFDLYGETRK